MFNRKKKKVSLSRIDSLIGHHTHIIGDISFSGGLRVDGSVAGNLNATGDNESVLVLSEQGTIEGNVRVPNLMINGFITGNVYASEHVEIAAKAKIIGNVYYHLLEMATGCEVNGQLIHVTGNNGETLGVEHEFLDTDKEVFNLEQKPET